MEYVTFGIRDLQANLGKALEATAQGKHVIITSRNKPVALLSKFDERLKQEDPTEWKLRRMAAEGRIVLGRGGRIAPFKPAKGGSGVVAQFLRDRR